jgi:ZIP family zinc transporter
MSTVTQVLIYGGIAGLTIPLGASLGQQNRIRSAWAASEIRHGVLAFGAGALLAAVALVLVPSGMESLSLPGMTIAVFGGVRGVAKEAAA